ncbi:hypothetical protein DICVIV_11191 [Dictyocaulus viviparus]|uniref:PPM-type phosphatase domain-containing protein n=1 Tax=Dictyocaulus viviparus TaxID=29172 RepID=A0A0D8XDY9_DICVI|nr:hypothetical protein DICVIV_11191 [Dictyocaulus viviparus]
MVQRSTGHSYSKRDLCCANSQMKVLVKEIHRLDDILSRRDPNNTSLTGSTMIAAIMEDNRYLSVVNVGDSRAVACDMQNHVVILSKDHKPEDTGYALPGQRPTGFADVLDTPTGLVISACDDEWKLAKEASHQKRYRSTSELPVVMLWIPSTAINKTVLRDSRS